MFNEKLFVFSSKFYNSSLKRDVKLSVIKKNTIFFILIKPLKNFNWLKNHNIQSIRKFITKMGLESKVEEPRVRETREATKNAVDAVDREKVNKR